jgi:hypothetical protein
MHPFYFETRFRVETRPQAWPESFAIVTAWATTGEHWSLGLNSAADSALAAILMESGAWTHRVTGYSPSTGHSEPGWAVVMDWETACDIGQRFLQDAIYWVEGNQLGVTFCDHRRQLVPVATFSGRLD